MYGFHKVPHLQQGALKVDQPSQNEVWEFTNPCFQRDQPELMAKVQRKRSGKEREHHYSHSVDDTPTTTHSTTSNALTRNDFSNLLNDSNEFSVAPLQLNSLLSAIQSIKNNQRTIIEEVSTLQQSSQALWQQSLDNRQQLQRQQETVNRILRFLAGVFGQSNIGDILRHPFEKESGLDAETRFQNHDAINKTRGPVRPQKRARLLIGDQSHADMMADQTDSNESDAAAANEMRFSDVVNDADMGSPNSWTGIMENADSPNASPSVSSPPHTRLASQGAATPPQTNQALLQALAQSNDTNAWLMNMLASQSQRGGDAASRTNPQWLASLPNGELSQAGSNSETGQHPTSDALVHSLLAADRTPASMDGARDEVALPEAQFAQNVQRVQQNAQSNMDQTTQLQNQINTLVRNMRLDPNTAQNPSSLEPGAADRAAAAGLMPEAPPSMPGWQSMAPGVQPPSYMPPSPRGVQPAANNGLGDFDIDSFLNQFVEGMPSQGNNGVSLAPSPVPEEMEDVKPTVTDTALRTENMQA